MRWSSVVFALLPGLALAGFPSSPADPEYKSACISASSSSFDSHHHRHHKVDHHKNLQNADNLQFEIRDGKDTQNCVAWGYYDDQVDKNGWSYFSVESNPSFNDNIQMRAAGFLEGVLTATRIYQYKQNAYWQMFNSTTAPTTLLPWTSRNEAFNRLMVKTHTTSPYWVQVGLMYTQLEGIYLGLNYTGTNNGANTITWNDLINLNLNGDVSDVLRAAVNITQRPDFPNMSLNDVLYNTMLDSHCSALVKVVDDYSDLFAAHMTWSNFATMLRVYKRYNLPLHSAVNKDIQFSGYPATLYSTDDLYELRETSLTVLETTNSVYDMTLYQYVHTESVLVWIRAMVANRLASTGRQWGKYFRQYNSGTYNNQWMIVDHKQFKSGSKPSAGTLYIVSQIPGDVHIEDVTDILINQTYWASYNVPYYKPFYNRLGFEPFKEKFGEYYFGYENGYRALLFRREQVDVHTIDDMKRVMMLNRWQTDPLSRDNPANAIASRYDLVTKPALPTSDYIAAAFGGLDTKITQHSKVVDGTGSVVARSGPTHDDQKPFSFSGRWASIPHNGMPITWDFDWVEFDWS